MTRTRPYRLRLYYPSLTGSGRRTAGPRRTFATQEAAEQYAYEQRIVARRSSDLPSNQVIGYQIVNRAESDGIIADVMFEEVPS